MEKIPEQEKKEIPGAVPGKESMGEKIMEELYGEKKEELEKREFLTEKEKIIREKLENEVAKMRLSPQLQDDAAKKAQQIKDLDQKGKIMRLLNLAEEKGVVFAVKVAKEMKDPHALDIFHDILARDSLYKKFEK